MTSKLFKTAFVAAMASASIFGTTQAMAATASADAHAQILVPVSIEKTKDLEFGTIIVGATGGTVTISQAGVRACDVALVCKAGDVVSAATFNVKGTLSQQVHFSVPATISLSNGTQTMTAALSSSETNFALGGPDHFVTVGAVLTVGASQAEGSYTAQFDATVDYL